MAIPLLVETHEAYADVVAWLEERNVALCGHALAETYSVLTRLPGDLRVEPGDAVRLLDGLDKPLVLAAQTYAQSPATLAKLGIADGAVYDALVGLAAVEHDAELATRDLRAKATYEAVGARVVALA